MDKEFKLSEKENELLNYIKNRKEEVELNHKAKNRKEEVELNYIVKDREDITAETIKTDLGESYLGALGKLLRYDLIEVTKKQIEHALNKYGTHYVKVYIPKKVGE